MVPTSGDEPRALASLAVQKGPSAGRELPITQPVVEIGKGSQSDVVIEDDSVSTAHARLEYERGAWRIIDLGSTNGTFVEGVRLAPEVPTPLTYGSTVRFGGVQTHFRPVRGADPDAARAAYQPPMRAERPGYSGSGVRLPLWIFVLLLLILLAVVFWVLGAPGVRADDLPPAADPEAVLTSASVAPA